MTWTFHEKVVKYHLDKCESDVNLKPPSKGLAGTMSQPTAVWIRAAHQEYLTLQSYHILAVIGGVIQTRCNSHRVLDCAMRAGLKKGVRYRLEVYVSLREYGSFLLTEIPTEVYFNRCTFQ